MPDDIKIKTMAKKSKKLPATKLAQTKSASEPAASFGGPMDPLLLERLIKLMSANDMTSLEVSEGAQRISLQRGPQFVSAGPAVHSVQAAPTHAHAAPPVAAAAPAAPATKVDDEAGLKKITSPMVGTFYSKPSPDAKAFVQVGTVVNEDSDVCVIEAMKVFNNIKAELKGTIARVCVTDGQTVEFGTVLFLVKP